MYYIYTPSYKTPTIVKFDEPRPDLPYGQDVAGEFRTQKRMVAQSYFDHLTYTPSFHLQQMFQEHQRIEREIRDRELNFLMKSVLPPLRWEADGQIWVRKLSLHNNNDDRAFEAMLELDQLMQERSARPLGGLPCAIRDQLIHELFDEMIRLSGFVSPDYGNNLITIRNEFHKMLEIYNTGYDGLHSYRSRKIALALSGKGVKDKQVELKKLQGQLEVLRGKYAKVKKVCDEREEVIASREAYFERTEKEKFDFLKKKASLFVGLAQTSKLNIDHLLKTVKDLV